jgi:hypothetical protein
MVRTAQILVEEKEYNKLPKSLKDTKKFCKVVRIQRTPYLGVLKLHKTFRVVEK